MKNYVFIAAFILTIISLAQLGSAIMVAFLAILSIAVIVILVAAIMDINQPLKKPNKTQGKR